MRASNIHAVAADRSKPRRPEKRRANAPPRTAAPREPAAVVAAPAVVTPTVAARPAVPVRALATLALVALALVPSGPLDFLPWVLRAPLVLGAVAWWWRPVSITSVPREIDFALVSLSAIVFLLLKLVGIHPSSTDDNIYIYMADRLAHGVVPYRDFFFAHPPVHLLVPALLFKIFGTSIGLAKTVPVLAQSIAAACLYLALRPVHRGVAALSLVLHLTAFEVLESSNDLNGQDVMTMFVFAAVLAASRKKIVLAGVLAGLGLGSALYGLAVVLALGIAIPLQKSWRYALGVMAGFWVPSLPFIALAGSKFFDGVFRYHLVKPTGTGDRVPVFDGFNPFSIAGNMLHNLGVYFHDNDWLKTLYYHAPLWFGVLGACVVLAGSRVSAWIQEDGPTLPTLRPAVDGSLESFVTFALAGIVLSLLEYSAFNRLFSFYTVPMIVLLSVPAAYALLRVVTDFDHGKSLTPALLAGLFALGAPVAHSLVATIWPEEERHAGERVDFRWRPLWYVPALSEPARVLFFTDHRDKGDVVPPYRQYVWHKLQRFSQLAAIGAYVHDHTEPDETLLGASGYAPQVALVAGRRVSGDEADTNSMRFQSGLSRPEEIYAKACADRVRYVLSAPRSFFEESAIANNSFVQRNFAREQSFDDAELMFTAPVHFTLYRRRDIEGLPAGRVCEVP